MKTSSGVLVSAAVVAFVLAASPALAQQDVPFRGGIPVAPTLETPPLPDQPVEYDTAEGLDIRLVVYARGLTYPMAMAFLPGGDMLVAERTGNLRIVRDGVVDPNPVPGVPESRFGGESGMPNAVHGLMDIALHPDFADNGYVYLTYTKPTGNQSATALARGRWDGSALTGTTDIFVAEGGGGASRIAFGTDGTLFMTVSGGDAQNTGVHGGKVLRLNDDGSVPDDNPFVGRAGYKPEIYSLGHRSSLGLAVHPGTGEVWQNENGPNGGDEINIIQRGANYGWPLVSYGRAYQGQWHNERPTHEVFEPPVVYWMPAIAPSGMMFYTGDRLPQWKGDVFVGSMRTGEINGTGHLERILFNTEMLELRRESLLTDLRQRIRDVRQGPDELIYMVNEAEVGAVLRIEPVE
jgi:glucose/arabinose dehydrogenase